MKVTFVLPALFASALFAPATVYALQPIVGEPITLVGEISAVDDRNSQYAEGTRAINEGRWADAGTIFSKIAAQHGDRADGALYWKAYAENKAGQSSSALKTCSSLGQAYPKSRYITDCDALRVEIQGAGAHTITGGRFNSPSGRHNAQESSNPDEDLKLLALNAVMQQDESRALPIIQQILNGNGSDRLKERALFVLTQSNSPQAQQTLEQIVRGQSNPALQIKAIRMFAALEGKRSVDTLADVYQRSSDEGVKRTILQSYLVTGSSDKLLVAARGEQNPELVRSAVRSLGAMGATSDLSTLYHDSKDQRMKTEIINAFIAAGPKGADELKSIATTEQDPELRRRAIRNLGASGGASAAPALLAAYQSSPDVESKKAAIDGLFISNSAHELVTLARAEKDPDLKQAIATKLSIMHNKEATDYMMEILNK
ncbi:HEAT repeat domain-containing protein [Edaphobacter flagellatus]|uniref:HEAT repeat domain-containing protein n=1 Tax=Edaphobacter flagellatus TaxID=1933044 RepID=UPI0021B1D6AF|nr:HEAT repeat domain-containing protein [Edaphobacter flagellatus]